MDMGTKETVSHCNNLYRYVLSVIDVFSRFVWLRPLSGKNSKCIASELEKIYLEHGPPSIIQSDQGGEFKGALKRLCRRMKIKMIHSRPYHPPSQGKVERSHGYLRSKIEYDFIKLSKEGFNWVENLANYQRILNEDPKEVLGYRSPFEVYFSRISNAINRLSKPGVETERITSKKRKRCNQSTSEDRNRRKKNAINLRKDAHKATARFNNRMVKAYARSNPPSKYAVGEKVYVRLPGKGRLHKKRHITDYSTKKT